MAQVSPCVSFHIIHACALVSCCLSGLSSPVSLLLPPVLLPALPDVHPGAPDEISMEDPLCDSSLGSMVTLDYVTPLTFSMQKHTTRYVFIGTNDTASHHTVQKGEQLFEKWLKARSRRTRRRQIIGFQTRRQLGWTRLVFIHPQRAPPLNEEEETPLNILIQKERQ